MSRAGTLTPRRTWGTLALAISNLSAATVLVDPGAMDDASIHRIALRMMDSWAWGALFLLAGAGLIAAVWRRSLGLVHVFGTLSITVWTALSVGAFLSDVTDDAVKISGLGIALFVWMFLGPLAMLLVPVVYEYRLHRELDG